MKITIIDGSLQDFVSGNDKGVISVSESCIDTALNVASEFLDYGKTVVLESDSEGE